jgi:hypothetical protein
VPASTGQPGAAARASRISPSHPGRPQTRSASAGADLGLVWAGGHHPATLTGSNLATARLGLAPAGSGRVVTASSDTGGPTLAARGRVPEAAVRRVLPALTAGGPRPVVTTDPRIAAASTPAAGSARPAYLRRPSGGGRGKCSAAEVAGLLAGPQPLPAADGYTILALIRLTSIRHRQTPDPGKRTAAACGRANPPASRSGPGLVGRTEQARTEEAPPCPGPGPDPGSGSGPSEGPGPDPDLLAGLRQVLGCRGVAAA